MKYVEKYFILYKGKMKNFGDVYMVVYWLVVVGKDDDYVMYKCGLKEYGVNKNFDFDNDGVVICGDMLQCVCSVFGSGGFLEGFLCGFENGVMGGIVFLVIVIFIGFVVEGVGFIDIVDIVVCGIESVGSVDVIVVVSVI